VDGLSALVRVVVRVKFVSVLVVLGAGLLVALLVAVTALGSSLPTASAGASAPTASLSVFYRACNLPNGSASCSSGRDASGVVMRVRRCLNGTTHLFVATDEREGLRLYACKTGGSYIVARKDVSVQVIPVKMNGHSIVARGRTLRYESACAIRG